MHSQTVRYARNGALAAIAVYLLIAVPLLGLSMSGSESTISSQPSSTEAVQPSR